MINILILEDDPIISLDIKAIIDDMDGFNSFIASNISDALKIAHKYILHIVLADIQIKGLIDGIDTAKTLQQLYHCQVIFLISFNDDVIATAILDRLLHHSHPFLINGPSYRMKDLLPKSKKKQNLENKNNEI